MRRSISGEVVESAEDIKDLKSKAYVLESVCIALSVVVAVLGLATIFLWSNLSTHKEIVEMYQRDSRKGAIISSSHFKSAREWAEYSQESEVEKTLKGRLENCRVVKDAYRAVLESVIK